MPITFTKLSPGGNDTIIVTSPVPASKRASLARVLMSDDVGAEQVGYLSYPVTKGIDARLDMMGGELCINGIRCVARLLASESSKKRFCIASSGTDRVFECRTRFIQGRCFVSISLCIKPVVKKLEDDVFLVHLDGMSLILWECDEREIKKGILPIFTKLRERYAAELKDIPAFGVVPFLRTKNAYSIFPVIYVRDTDSTTIETGCGSASMALAIALRSENSLKKFRVLQPSGSFYELVISGSATDITIELGSFVDQLVVGTAFTKNRSFVESGVRDLQADSQHSVT